MKPVYYGARWSLGTAAEPRLSQVLCQGEAQSRTLQTLKVDLFACLCFRLIPVNNTELPEQHAAYGDKSAEASDQSTGTSSQSKTMSASFSWRRMWQRLTCGRLCRIQRTDSCCSALTQQTRSMIMSADCRRALFQARS